MIGKVVVTSSEPATFDPTLGVDLSGRSAYPSEAARIIGHLKIALEASRQQTAAQECAKALDALRRHNPDVVLTDEEMIAILRGKGYEVTDPHE